MQLQSNELGQALGFSAAAVCAVNTDATCCGGGGILCDMRPDRDCPMHTQITVIIMATAGNWHIKYGAATSTNLAYNISLAALKTAVEDLDGSFVGKVTVETYLVVGYKIIFDESLGDISASFLVESVDLISDGLPILGGGGFAGSSMPTLWLIEPSGVGIGRTNGGIETHGDITRPFYVSGHQEWSTNFGTVPCYSDKIRLNGRFFTDANSANGYGASADGGSGSRHDADWLYFTGLIGHQVVAGPTIKRYMGGGFYFDWGWVPDSGDTFSSALTPLFSTSGNDENLGACTEPSVTTNLYTDFVTYDSYGQDGTFTATPCPPCPKTLTNPACLAVTVDSGTCDDVAGEYQPDTTVGPNGFARSWQDLSEVPSATCDMNPLCGGFYFNAPAGCVWVYRRIIGGGNPFLQSPQLYIWFDGVDWRMMIARDLAVSGISGTCADGHAFFPAVELISTGDSGITEVSGALHINATTLRAVKSGSSLHEGSCADDAVVTVKECGSCPDDCTNSCPRVEFTIENFSGGEDATPGLEQDTMDPEYPTTCVWTTSGGRLECIGNEWVLTFEESVISDPIPGGAKYTAPVDPDHPNQIPADPAAWTRIFGTTFGLPMDILAVAFKEIGGIDGCTPS